MFALQQHNTVLIKENDGRFGFIHYSKLAAHTALKQTNLIINKIKVIYVAFQKKNKQKNPQIITSFTCALMLYPLTSHIQVVEIHGSPQARRGSSQDDSKK